MGKLAETAASETAPLLSHGNGRSGGRINNLTDYNACEGLGQSNSHDEEAAAADDVELPVEEEMQRRGKWGERLRRALTNTFSKERLTKTFGIILVMCAGFSFTTSNVMQKFSVRELSFWQLLANRALVQLIGMAILCVVSHLKHGRREGHSWGYMFLGPRSVRIRTVSQGLLGGTLLACMFIAVKYVPLGNASAIMFCTPIFTFLMAPCMLGERFGLYRLLITILMALGVLFIARPSAVFGPDSIHHTNSSHHHHHHHDRPLTLSYIMPDEALPHPPPTLTFPDQDNLPAAAAAVIKRDLYTAMIPLVHWKDNEGQTEESSSAEENEEETSGSGVEGGMYQHLTPTQATVGYLTCFAVPFLSALISIITRQCNIAKVPVIILMFWFGVGATLVVVIATIALNDVTTLFDLSSREFLFLLSITALGLFGNMCYTFAVKFVSPSLANVFRSFEVILNFILQIELEKMSYHSINFVGIVLLLTAVVVMSLEVRAHQRWGRTMRFL